MSTRQGNCPWHEQGTHRRDSGAILTLAVEPEDAASTPAVIILMDTSRHPRRIAEISHTAWLEAAAVACCQTFPVLPAPFASICRDAIIAWRPSSVRPWQASFAQRTEGTDMSQPIVFGAAYSVYVRTVRLTLEEKNVPYHLVEIDVFCEGGPPPDYLMRHPFGRIPAFEHDGFQLYETDAIVRYIDETFDGPPLIPDTSKGRARMTQAMRILDCYAYPSMVWGVYVEQVERAAGRPRDEFRQARRSDRALAHLSGSTGTADGRRSIPFRLHAVPRRPACRADVRLLSTGAKGSGTAGRTTPAEVLAGATCWFGQAWPRLTTAAPESRQMYVIVDIDRYGRRIERGHTCLRGASLKRHHGLTAAVRRKGKSTV